MYVIELNKDFVIPLLSEKNSKVIELVLVTSGFLILEGNLNPIRINAQEIHLSVSNNSVNILESSNNLAGWYCKFDAEFINNYFIHEDLNNEIEVLSSFLYQYPLRLTNKVYRRLSFHFDSLFQLYSEGSGDLSLIKSYFSVCIFEIRKLIKESALDFYPAKAFSIVKQYNDLLLKHIEQEQDVNFYSSKLRISPNHLNKSVKTVLRKTAIHFLNEKRIIKAKQKLQHTDLPMIEIATQLGFMDQSYFSRFFKKNTGQAPSEYRKLFFGK